MNILPIAFALAAAMPVDYPPARYPARVSENRHFLLDQGGKPFFYLGDTAWELFHRLDYGEADRYLRDRKAKGFTVIQAVVLAEFGGLVEPNAAGHLPLKDNDPTKPNEAYFDDVDRIALRADELGLVLGMLPTWGDKWNKKWGMGPEIFTPENASKYGEFLGRRYRDRPIIWILGGDRPIESERQKQIIRAMAEGLRKGDEGNHLIAFHPSGGRSSSEWFQNDAWIDFNMIQSGHGYDHDNGSKIAADYARTPIKPCIDAEPGYEDHPAEFNPKNGYLGDLEVRKAAYWALFAGACGHTYGCHDIWQFLGPKRPAVTYARIPWTKALDLPGASQVGYARALIESRPVLSRIPDQSLVIGKGGERIRATRDEGGSYAFIYTPTGNPFSVDLSKMSGKFLRASWFDPRTGKAEVFGTFPREGRREFTAPSKGTDWILVLDDESRKFPLPTLERP